MKIEDQRRHSFEEFAKTVTSVAQARRGEGYCDSMLNLMWIGWNAAMDSMVIELPGASWFAEVAELNCPEGYGFEGPQTFSDCGECEVCRAKAMINNGFVVKP